MEYIVVSQKKEFNNAGRLKEKQTMQRVDKFIKNMD